MKRAVLITVMTLPPALTADSPGSGESLRPPSPGFHRLKGDLHLHTVFSDGQVWQSFRVSEAVREVENFLKGPDEALKASFEVRPPWKR